jgi:BTB/POZ domain
MEIKCKFATKNSVYTCKAESAAITERCEMKSFKGKHETGKSCNDVVCLWILGGKVHYLPSGINKIFPQLKILHVINCKLKEITAVDLLGLEDLKLLWLEGNELKSLPDDLFLNMKNLAGIGFKGNKLEVMSSRLLDPFPDGQLTCVNFLNSMKINACYFPSDDRSLKSIKELKDVIDSSFSPSQIYFPTSVRKTINEYKNLWDIKKNSDLTIVVGAKKIRVHKCILAVQSPVFDATFYESEKVLDKLEIKDSSEEAFEMFLRCLYTGEVENEKNALEIFALACKYQVEDVKKVYEKIVIKYFDQQDPVEVFKVGNRHKSSEMVKISFAKLKEMFPNEIQSDDLEFEPERVIEIVNTVYRFGAEIQQLNKH